MSISTFYNGILQEAKNQKKLIAFVAFIMVISYSVYLWGSDKFIINVGLENHPIELGTALSLFAGSVMMFMAYKRNKSVFLILLGLVLFFGAGEELSWGQQLVHFHTPAAIDKENVQHEFNVHNLDLFNAGNLDKTRKTGWHRLTEMNFLFRLFCISYGIFIPFLAMASAWANGMLKKLRMPIPPITVGIFFAVNWLLFRFILDVAPKGKPIQYYCTSSENFEFVAGVILMVFGYYFWQQSKTKQA